MHILERINVLRVHTRFYIEYILQYKKSVKIMHNAAQKEENIYLVQISDR